MVSRKCWEWQRRATALGMGMGLLAAGSSVASCALSFDDYPLPGTPSLDAGDAGDPGDGGPAIVLVGDFVSLAVPGATGGYKLRGTMLWHGSLRGQGGGYILEGTFR